jgi:hypothetical protein
MFLFQGNKPSNMLTLTKPWCFPAGLIPMQQQGFPMVSVMQPNMQGMMGMNYSSQMSQGPIAMQVLAS